MPGSPPCVPWLPPLMFWLPPFMFWQLCVDLLGADGEGVAAGLTEPTLTAVVADPDDDVGVVAAPATARPAPSPTPSAPAPMALARTIVPSLVFNVSAS